MAIFSKITTLDIPCKEYVHPWCDSCTDATIGVLPSCVKESFRIYTIAYGVALLMRGKIPSENEIRKTFLGILRSSIFLTLHGVSFSATICLLRRILGNFNFLTVAFIPKFLISLCTILIERPSRRGLLSLYVTNVASETLFRMAVSRNIFTPLPYGEVLIFSISASYLLYHYRGFGLPKDPVYSLLRFLVGPYEEVGYCKMDDFPYPPKKNVILYSDNTMSQLYKSIQNKWRELVYRIQILTSHQSCPHPFSCLHYVLSGSLKKFLIGSSLNLALSVALSFKKILSNPVYLKKVLSRKGNLNLGICFGLFTALFRGVSCLLRRKSGKDNEMNALPAGFIAGLAFYFYRNNTIALYFMWKTFQLSYNVGVEKGLLPEIPHASVLFYAISTAVLFHVAIMEPHNLRPSYWKFLVGMSGGRIARMGRVCLDPFGLQTSESLAQVMKGKNPIDLYKV